MKKNLEMGYAKQSNLFNLKNGENYEKYVESRKF